MPSKLASSICRVCLLGSDRERVLIAIQPDPRASRTRIVREFHITHSVPKQKQIFDSIPFVYRDGAWVTREN